VAVINFARREIEAKIVFYGPALSGKTTNVCQAYRALPEDDRGELRRLETQDERTLYFDYAPITRGEIAGFVTKFKLFSVPGQVFYKETRRIVLQGVDGVVFVADSDPERTQANIDALMDLEDNLRHQGLELARIPLVIQFNKRDLPDVRSVQAMNTDLNPMGVPIIEAVATDNTGVMETLEAVTGIVSVRIRDGLAGRRTGVTLAAVDTREQQDDSMLVENVVAEIDRVRPMEEARGKSVMQRFEIDTQEVDAFLLANVERRDKAPPESVSEELPAEPDPSEELVRPSTPTSPVAPEEFPPGPRVEMGFLPASLTDYQVARLMDSSVDAEGALTLELFMNGADGGRSRCTVVLKPESRYLRTPRAPRPTRRAPEVPEKRTPVALFLGVALGAFILGASLALTFGSLLAH
jgi:signal recognition particle receptor subunit beta